MSDRVVNLTNVCGIWQGNFGTFIPNQLEESDFFAASFADNLYIDSITHYNPWYYVSFVCFKKFIISCL